MQRSDSSLERVDTRGGRFVVTGAARDAIGRLCRDDGRQTVLLCWPGGAVCLPLSLCAPAAFDVIIGHIARCPIHVDIRQLRFTAGTHAVLDATQACEQRPVLRPRPAQPEPIITACARDPDADLHGLIQRRSTTADGRQAGHGVAAGDGRRGPASGHGDQLTGRPIFGASTHRLAASPAAKEREQQ
jgi:hypothetical protein